MEHVIGKGMGTTGSISEFIKKHMTKKKKKKSIAKEIGGELATGIDALSKIRKRANPLSE